MTNPFKICKKRFARKANICSESGKTEVQRLVWLLSVAVCGFDCYCRQSPRWPGRPVLFGGHFFGFAFLAHPFEFAFCGFEFCGHFLLDALCRFFQLGESWTLRY
jgi:hypothetical protein